MCLFWSISFPGHDIHVHREFYRQSDNMIELSKVVKLLIASEEGNMHKYHGMTLEQIEFSSGDEDETMENDGETMETEDPLNTSITKKHSVKGNEEETCSSKKKTQRNSKVTD